MKLRYDRIVMFPFSHLNQTGLRHSYPSLSPDQYTLFRSLGVFFARLATAHGLSVRRVRKLGHGTISAVLLVETDTEKFVMKISVRDDLVSEAFFLQRAASVTSVPRVLLADFSRQIIPYDYLFLSFVLGSLPHNLTLDVRRRGGEKLGAALARIHTLPAKGVGTIVHDRFSYRTSVWQQLLIASLRSTWRTVHTREKAFLPRYQKQVENILRSPVLKKFSPRILHGDVGGNNYLVEVHQNPRVSSPKPSSRWRVKKAHFIDPGTWVGGDPMQDVAFSQISWNYAGFSEGFWKGYVREHPLSDVEQERLRILRIYNQYWATMISRERDRSRWKKMFLAFQKLLQNKIS